MELRDALAQIEQIRGQIAHVQVFKGFRAAATAVTGGVAIVAAVAQSVLLPDPLAHSDLYLLIWAAAALVSVGIVGVAVALRYLRSDSELDRQVTISFVEQFVPALVAGMLVTFVLGDMGRAMLWIMPGLWSVLFSLGIFASRRLLPRAARLVGGFYLLAGIVLMSRPDAALSPWAMGLTFSLGQFFAAGVLYWTLERRHER